jgi:prefoldin beta subunit
MEQHLPPAAREKYQELQELQEEATEIVSEKEQAEEQLEDSEAALDALEDADDDEIVHRQVGRVRVGAPASEVRPDLESEIEELEARIDELEGLKADLEERFENRKKDIKHLLGGQTGGLGTPGTDEQL